MESSRDLLSINSIRFLDIKALYAHHLHLALYYSLPTILFQPLPSSIIFSYSSFSSSGLFVFSSEMGRRKDPDDYFRLA